MSSRKLLQNRSYYLEALQQHKRTVALIIAVMVTAPLFAFTSLPPVEVIEEVPVESGHDEPVDIIITEERVIRCKK